MSYRLKIDASSDRFSQLSTSSSCVSDSRLKASEAYGAVAVDTHPDHDTKKLLVRAILEHPVLSQLPSDDIKTLINALQYFEIGAHEFLYEAGSLSRHLYFLNTGTVRLGAKTKEDVVVKPGAIFGDQALIGGARAESAWTIDATTFWRLSSESVLHFVGKIKSLAFHAAKSTIAACGFDYFLSSAEVSQMAAELLPCKYQQGHEIVRQGESGEVLFLLASGEATVQKNDCLVRVINRGHCFGEQAILYGGVRSATVGAISAVECFAIEKNNLVRVLGSSYDQVLYRNSITIALDESSALSGLEPQVKESLIAAMKIKAASVIRAGRSMGERLYIVLDGELKSADGSSWTRYCCIGAEEIRAEKSAVFERDIVPELGTVVGEIGREEFLECLGTSWTSLDLGRVRLFHGFTAEAKERLTSLARVQCFSKGEVIVSEAAASGSVFIVKSGTVHLSRCGRVLRILSQFDSFGERNFVLANSLWATAKAVGDVECWVLPASAVDIPQMAKYELTHDAQSEAVNLRDLTCVERLGCGQFGGVFFSVTPKPATYALKCLSRRRIESGNLQHDVLNERNVLLQLNHPMTVKLHRTLSDEDNIYFLLEHVEGMLFFNVLLKLNICTELIAQFYMGCLVLIFEHLHERHIVYRDLKPENVMVDTAGFLKLIDFGSAKRVVGRTRTVIGTPQYMAPEMILGKAYDRAVDLWSLGIVLYELLCGGVPFGEGQEDTYLVFEQVLSAPLKFPAFIDERSPACALIAQLLERNPRDRATLDHLKKHEFMSGVDYESLLTRQCHAPYLPKPKDHSTAICRARQNPKPWVQALEEEGLDEELDLPVKRPGAAPGPDWDRCF